MGGWMNKIKDIKEQLYELMLIACDSVPDNGDTKVSQNLGIAMSNAVKKGGVVNIISQNITFQKVIPKIVEIVKGVDELEYAEVEYQEQVLQIEHKKVEALPDPVEECCKFFYEQRFQWKEFRDTMRMRYMDYVRKQCKTNQEAARFLNVHNSYVTKNVREAQDEIS